MGKRKKRKEYFFDLNSKVIEKVLKVMHDFPNIIQPTQNDQADPYLVAYALTYPDICIVTEEKKESKLKRVSIPFVCEHYEIKCIKFYELIDELKITV